MSKALELAVHLGSGIFTYGNHIGPGQVVLRQSTEVRDVLKTLTSQEAANVREDCICDPNHRKRRGRWGIR